MRVLVLSDIHSNLEALETVLQTAPVTDAVWVLGDTVGYGPEPDAVVARIRALDAVVIQGNHDAAAAGGPEIAYFNPDAARAMEWTRATISEETAGWLAALPEVVVQGDYTLAHGSPREPIWEYVTNLPGAQAAFEALATPNGLIGHTHLPAAYLLADEVVSAKATSSGLTIGLDGYRALLNPGSVGQPRDGIPAASWMVLDTTRATATWHRTAYDVAAVQAAMQRVSLPVFLRERLAFGR